MAQLSTYQQIIQNILRPYTEVRYANVDVRNRAAFDTENDQYVILSEGWDNKRHLHGCLIHVEIINGKVWVQQDGTEDGITNDLVAAGIPKSDIVLGFQELAVRPYTGFAVA